MRENKGVGDNDSLAFISGGDFNSLPISSAMSAFYNENIESGDYVKANEVPSVWQIPEDLDKEKQRMYR